VSALVQSHCHAVNSLPEFSVPAFWICFCENYVLLSQSKESARLRQLSDTKVAGLTVVVFYNSN
jgi:hypothetical protein